MRGFSRENSSYKRFVVLACTGKKIVISCSLLESVDFIFLFISCKGGNPRI